MGVTLTAANTVVFAELYWTPGALMQAEDRVHRVGQTRPVQIKYVLGESTADEKIWWMLEKKFSILGEMFGQTGARIGGTKSNFDEDLKQTDMQEFINAVLGTTADTLTTKVPLTIEKSFQTQRAKATKKQKTEDVIVNVAAPLNWLDTFEI